MVSPSTRMEIHPVCAVKHADAVIGVLAGMAVHDVNQHNQSQPVSLVHQGFQLIRGSKPAAGLHHIKNCYYIVVYFIVYTYIYVI